MMLTDEMKQKYLRDPSRCPFCQSEKIETIDATNQGTQTFVEVLCQTCRNEWMETYQIVQIEQINLDERRPPPREYIPGYQ